MNHTNRVSTVESKESVSGAAATTVTAATTEVVATVVELDYTRNVGRDR